MRISGTRSTVVGISALVVVITSGVLQAEPQTGASPPIFARVNGEAILQNTYETALRVAGRQRFYHGQAPETELIAFRKEVAEKLIDERLFHQEALRRGLKPDAAWVEVEFGKIEKRYSVSPQWQESGAALQQQVREGLAARSLIEQVDASLRTVPEPSDEQVRAYYQDNPDKFTSPEQIKVSSILLRVEPWQPREVWDETRQRAGKVLTALETGESFEKYAEQYPPQDSAQLGYIHRGMLGESAQSAIDKLEVGQRTDVVDLLEGFAIFRLDARKPAALNPYDDVKERAKGLASREQSEKLYRERTEALRASAEVEYTNPSFYSVADVGRLRDRTHLKPAQQNE